MFDDTGTGTRDGDQEDNTGKELHGWRVNFDKRSKEREKGCLQINEALLQRILIRHYQSLIGETLKFLFPL
jgi:hypothetical protein